MVGGHGPKDNGIGEEQVDEDDESNGPALWEHK